MTMGPIYVLFAQPTMFKLCFFHPAEGKVNFALHAISELRCSILGCFFCWSEKPQQCATKTSTDDVTTINQEKRHKRRQS